MSNLKTTLIDQHLGNPISCVLTFNAASRHDLRRLAFVVDQAEAQKTLGDFSVFEAKTATMAEFYAKKDAVKFQCGTAIQMQQDMDEAAEIQEQADAFTEKIATYIEMMRGRQDWIDMHINSDTPVIETCHEVPLLELLFDESDIENLNLLIETSLPAGPLAKLFMESLSV